jgi:NAD(P)-dependent dehydrogenase (short-subunit alcohol dehydrogenase family)
MSEPFRRDAEVFAQAVAAIPAQRIAEPTDIAHVAAFLVSDLAAYVNGHCMMVDGGRIAGNPARLHASFQISSRHHAQPSRES